MRSGHRRLTAAQPVQAAAAAAVRQPTQPPWAVPAVLAPGMAVVVEAVAAAIPAAVLPVRARRALSLSHMSRLRRQV